MDQFASLVDGDSHRHALLPDTAKGPYALETSNHAATESGAIGGQTVVLEVGRGAPLMVQSPAPSPAALGRIPTMYHNPNHYDFPPNLGGRQVTAPLASTPIGAMTAYDLRHDWRRPPFIVPAPIDPATGSAEA